MRTVGLSVVAFVQQVFASADEQKLSAHLLGVGVVNYTQVEAGERILFGEQYRCRAGDELINARLNYLRSNPTDPRGWVVITNYFVPLLEMDRAERVAYVNAARVELARALNDGQWPTEWQRAAMILVQACHEFEVELHNPKGVNGQLVIDLLNAAEKEWGETIMTGFLHDLFMRLLKERRVGFTMDHLAELSKRQDRVGNLAAKIDNKESIDHGANDIPTLHEGLVDSDWARLGAVLEGEWAWATAAMHKLSGTPQFRNEVGPGIVLLIQDRNMQDISANLERFITTYPHHEKAPALLRNYLIPYIPDFLKWESYPSINRTVTAREYIRQGRDSRQAQDWLKTGDKLVEKFLRISDIPLQERQTIVLFRIYRNVHCAIRQIGAWPAGWHTFHEEVAKHLEDYSSQPWFDASVTARAYVQFYLKWGLKLEARDAADYLGAKGIPESSWAGLFDTDDESKLANLRFTALDGRTVDLNDMLGKVVLIDFWATWCSPCVREMPTIKAYYKKYQRSGFEVIGISGDKGTKEQLQSFLHANGYTWPQHFDGKGTANYFAQHFGVRAWPTTYLVGKEGKLIGKNIRGESLEPAIRKALGLDR